MQMTDSPSIRGSSSGHSFRLPRRVFVGSLVSPQTLLSIKIINTAVIGVGTSGVIRFVEDLEDFKKAGISAQHQQKHSKSHDTLQEDDRSSTPVPIPNHDDSNGSSFLSEQIDSEKQHDNLDETAISTLVAKHGWNLQECELVRLSKDSFLCPGFIDTHTHAPQVPNLGLGQQYELLDWLQYVTFPREKVSLKE
jgi:guanine deaminase